MRSKTYTFLILIITVFTPCSVLAMGEDSTLNSQLLKETASIFCDINRVNQLLKEGADLTCENRMGWPLLHAVKNDNLLLAKLLLQKGENVKHQGYNWQTVLHFASSPQMSTLLLNAGADPFAQDYDGDTVLHYTARTNNIATTVAILTLVTKKHAQSLLKTAKNKETLQEVKKLRSFTNLIQRRLTTAQKLASTKNEKGLTAHNVAPEVLDKYEFNEEFDHLKKNPKLNFYTATRTANLREVITQNVLALAQESMYSMQLILEPTEKKAPSNKRKRKK